MSKDNEDIKIIITEDQDGDLSQAIEEVIKEKKNSPQQPLNNMA